MKNVKAFFLLLPHIFSASLNDALELNKNDPDSNQKNDLVFDAHEYHRNLFMPDGKIVDCLGVGKKIAKVINFVYDKHPKNLHDSGVLFSLSTRQNPLPLTNLSHIDISSVSSTFKIERQTVIIVPGFRSDGNKDWMIDMKNAFLEWNDVNVILIDWSKMANTWNYLKAAINTKYVAMAIAQILTATVDSLGNSDPKKWGSIHMVGHSLGAHISAMAARYYNSGNLQWTITRITGLDPANPCFKDIEASPLNLDDAKFVDVIHTNGKQLGLYTAVGHIDFYPNGGKLQRGCEKQREGTTRKSKNIFRFIKEKRFAVDEAICSHRRSHYIFTESIYEAARNGCTFWGHRWDGSFEGVVQAISDKCDAKKCVKMGILADLSHGRGMYYVQTGGAEPYCKLDGVTSESM